MTFLPEGINTGSWGLLAILGGGGPWENQNFKENKTNQLTPDPPNPISNECYIDVPDGLDGGHSLSMVLKKFAALLQKVTMMTMMTK